MHGSVPITPRVRDGILKQFKMLLRKDQVCAAFNEHGKVVGFALAMPNISRSVKKSKGRLMKWGIFPVGLLRILREARRPKYIDMLLLGVVEEYRGKGVNVIVSNELWKYCIRKNIISTESNLELETNVNMLGQSESWNKEFIRRRRCYVKKII
jgi:GNAT superfamily N-acetyltransferase